jgi:hypothetical protein
MKLNIALFLLAVFVLIALYFNMDKFSIENAKILTYRDDTFNFIDSDVLLKRARANFNKIKQHLDNPNRNGVPVRAVFINGACNFGRDDCPEGSSAAEDVHGNCRCAELHNAWPANYEFTPDI